MGVQFEDVLGMVGSFGPYQKKVVATFILPVVLLWSFFSMNHIFQLAIPDHWCFVEGREKFGLDLNTWKSLTLPKVNGSDGLERFAKCQQFNLSGVIEAAEDVNSLKERIWQAEAANILPTTNCQNGWTYDTSLYEQTASSQFNWVCAEQVKVTWAFTVTSVGTFIGCIIFNSLADIIGRRLTFYISASFHIVFGIALMYTANYYLFIGFLLIKSMSFPCCFQIAFIMVMEQIGPEKRGDLNGYFNLVYTIGMCILVMLAWLCKGHWVYFGYVTTLPVLAVYCYWPILKESPRWLNTRGRYEETAEILRHVAAKNGTKAPENLLDLLQEANSTKEQSFGIISLFSKPRTRIRTLITLYVWSVCVVVYFGLHLNINNLGGNDFLNFLVFAAIEFPAYFLAWKTSEKISRRWMQAGFMGLAAFALMLVALLPPGSLTETVVCSVIGKFGSSGAFMLIYLQAMEIFPTVNRAAAMGLSTFCGNVANILSPFAVSLGDYYQPAPYLIFGALAGVSCLVSVFLPESVHEPLPQTLEDSEQYGKEQKFWSLNKPQKNTPVSAKA